MIRLLCSWLARSACGFLLVACGASNSPPGDLDGSVIDGGSDSMAADRAVTDPIPSETTDSVGLDATSPDGIPDTEDAGTRLGPPYPIVLCHGFFGFEDFAGAGFLNYFFGVREALAKAGETQVFTPTVDPFNNSSVRGEQLLDEIESVLDMTGHEKVNLVCHSQGGLDARVVANLRPEVVASITTIATPHEGSPIADIVLGLVRDDRARDLVDAIARVIGAPLFDEIGAETSVVDALRQFGSEGIAEFNARYPDVPAVEYFSVGGRSDRHLGGRPCRAEASPEFVSRWNRNLDPIDPTLFLMEEILDGGLLAPEPNDGLVQVSASKRGRFLGCIPADHLDEIGQLFGDRAGLLNPFDHRVFYVEMAEWIRVQGF